MGRGHHRTQRGDGGRWCLFIFSVIESLYDTHSIRVVESELEIAFSVERSRTNLDDVDAFIAEHQNAKNSLVVEINRAGTGEAFADHQVKAQVTLAQPLRSNAERG